MSGHLCLKWNNHSVAFLKSVNSIQKKERYCDATIVCQGKYFPVHKFILSTCSDYFDEIFERIQCPHPYVVFKDIEPHEMELLLNYMYQGEVNVVQEMLPSLIKAAEALRIKGLAVPDDIPSDKEHSSSRKRSSTHDTPLSKRRSEEGAKRRKGDSIHSFSEKESLFEGKMNNQGLLELQDGNTEVKVKEEPHEEGDISEGAPPDNAVEGKTEPTFVDFSRLNQQNSYIKQEDGPSSENSFRTECSSWMEDSNMLPELSAPDINQPEDMDDRGGEPASRCHINAALCAVEMRSNAIGLTSCTEDRSSAALEVNFSGLEPRRVKNSKGDALSQCPWCGYRSPFRQNVQRHIKMRHTREKPFRCSFCSFRCTLKQQLDTHVRTHTGEKPYECLKCGARFAYRSSLNMHLRKDQCTQSELLLLGSTEDNPPSEDNS